MFGGWDFEADEVTRPDFTSAGYQRGVPMGGSLTDAPAGGAPRFMIRALRDPDGANLDRIQVVKGWLDGDGETHERIYDVAVSDGRRIGSDGRARDPVGNTVDIATATFTNTIGDPVTGCDIPETGFGSLWAPSGIVTSGWIYTLHSHGE